MADDRTYIKLHDGMPDHPKIEALSDRGFRLLVETWCWCSRHLTDGRVPQTSWAKRGTPASRKELIDAGLVDEKDGYLLVHDYLEHQRSAEEVAEAKEFKRNRSVRANHTRWHIGRDGRPSEDCPMCLQEGLLQGSSLESSESPTGSPYADPKGHPYSSQETETETEELQNICLLPSLPDPPVPPGWVDFWAAYPRKDDKKKAAEAYVQALKRALPETLVNGAKLYAKSKIGAERQHIALPTSWLNADRWTDDLAQRRQTDPKSGMETEISC